MIRLGVVLWVGLVGVASAVLFQVSYDVEALEGDLGSLNRAILREQDTIRVLHAEWAFLNQPTRLRTMAADRTGLRPIVPDQLITSVRAIPMPLPGIDGVMPLSSAATMVAVGGLDEYGLVPLPRRRPRPSASISIAAASAGASAPIATRPAAPQAVELPDTAAARDAIPAADAIARIIPLARTASAPAPAAGEEEDMTVIPPEADDPIAALLAGYDEGRDP
jgi:hypothetical protein